MPKVSTIGARQAAFRVLSRVIGSDAYADILLEKELDGLGEADRRLATEITYGVLRWLIRLDWAIDLFSSVKSKKLEHGVLNALRIGAYQLLFLTKVPASAAVNGSVELVRRLGRKKAGFVNAVLRNMDAGRAGISYPDIAGDPIKYASIVYSHPEWMVKRWVTRFGPEKAISLCESNQSVPPKTLRVNTLETSRERLIGELAGAGLTVRKTIFSPDGIEASGGRLDPKDTRYYIQDEASQLIPYLLSPKPGETILDLCSAPGGKATHMAQLMSNSGLICAVDKHRRRLKNVAEAARRLKTGIIRAAAADALDSIPFAMRFDAILIDAPCSGLGVLRRSPDIKYRRKEEDLKELGGVQRMLLEKASGYLEKGGRIVYSTCTFEPEETDGVIEGFLKDHKEFVLEDARGYMPEGCGGLVDARGFLRTYPLQGLDGFFGARLGLKGHTVHKERREPGTGYGEAISGLLTPESRRASDEGSAGISLWCRVLGGLFFSLRTYPQKG